MKLPSPTGFNIIAHCNEVCLPALLKSCGRSLQKTYSGSSLFSLSVFLSAVSTQWNWEGLSCYLLEFLLSSDFLSVISWAQSLVWKSFLENSKRRSTVPTVESPFLSTSEACMWASWKERATGWSILSPTPAIPCVDYVVQAASNLQQSRMAFLWDIWWSTWNRSGHWLIDCCKLNAVSLVPRQAANENSSLKPWCSPHPSPRWLHNMPVQVFCTNKWKHAVDTCSFDKFTWPTFVLWETHKVQHSFRTKTLKKIGIEGPYLGLIKAILTNLLPPSLWMGRNWKLFI